MEQMGEAMVAAPTIGGPGEVCNSWRMMDDGSGSGVVLIRLHPIDGERYIAVMPLLFTHAIITGELRHWYGGYEDRWCYHTAERAIYHATLWDGTGEPKGWHRHPLSGRRRDGGDPAKEVVES